MDADRLVREMTNALQRELELFEEMERLSREQLEILSSENPDAEQIARLIAQKQGIVKQLDELDEESGEAKSEWERAAQQVPEEQRESVRKAAGRISEVLQVLMELEKEIETRLKDHATEINRELTSILRARGALKAYGHQFGPEAARFLDRKR